MSKHLQIAVNGFVESDKALIRDLDLANAPSAKVTVLSATAPWWFALVAYGGNRGAPARVRRLRAGMMRLRMRLTSVLVILTLCVASGIGPTQAQMAQGDAKRGQELSQRVCSGCHSVSPGSAATVNADVPTFAAIACRPDTTAERLAGRIIVPHPPMPNVQLTVAEMRDIIAYILSLRPR